MTAETTANPLLMEQSAPGRRGYTLPPLDVPAVPVKELLPASQLGDAPSLPEVSESQVVRYFTRLSRLNHGVDVGFYPLGSCTMKYNPKVHEDIAAWPEFQRLHPYQPAGSVQGALRLCHELGQYLAEIAGLHACSLQPAAGAQGELAGLLIIKAYQAMKGEGLQRREIIVPDSAHGTNPASAAMAGYTVRTVPSNAAGGVDIKALETMVGPQTAGLMLTNPNTLGLFDEHALTIAEMVHDVGGLLYYDGANLNAILGRVRPGDMGFDIVHFNLHKTFSTPHGGGGPGAGPIAVAKELADFLPSPVISQDDGLYSYARPSRTIGRVKSFFGNFGVLVRAYAYIRGLGAEGLRHASEHAVLNSRYVMHHLKDHFDLPYDRPCMHEFVLSGRRQKEHGVTTLDMAKRLLDYGIHAPTIYFPQVVEEALMIEPTETETRDTLDAFIKTMISIADEAETNPDILRSAPHTTPVRRLDEVLAARTPILRWTAKNSN